MLWIYYVECLMRQNCKNRRNMLHSGLLLETSWSLGNSLFRYNYFSKQKLCYNGKDIFSFEKKLWFVLCGTHMFLFTKQNTCSISHSTSLWLHSDWTEMMFDCFAITSLVAILPAVYNSDFNIQSPCSQS